MSEGLRCTIDVTSYGKQGERRRGSKLSYYKAIKHLKRNIGSIQISRVI